MIDVDKLKVALDMSKHALEICYDEHVISGSPNVVKSVCILATLDAISEALESLNANA